MKISTKPLFIGGNRICSIHISGHISESSQFDYPQASGNPDPILILDLRDVDSINSHGSRLWIKWIEGLSQRSKIFLYQCAPVVVREMIRVSNFAGGADIISLRFPFICSKGCSQKSLVSMKPHIEEINDIERCQTCDKKLIFDGISAPYYSFLQKVQLRQSKYGSDLIRNFDKELSSIESLQQTTTASSESIRSSGENETGKEFLSEVGMSRPQSAVGGLKSVVFDQSSAFDFNTDMTGRKQSSSTERTLIYISMGLLAISLLFLIFILLK